jgi:hypothetical protein
MTVEMNKKEIKKNSDLIKGDKNKYNAATQGSFTLAMVAEMTSFSM